MPYLTLSDKNLKASSHKNIKTSQIFQTILQNIT